MALSDTDLVWYPSAIGASEGGAIGGVAITSGVSENLWPNLTQPELTAGGTRYRKIFIANESGADDMVLPVIWVSIPATNITERIGLGFDDSDDDEETGGVITQFTGNAIAEFVSNGSDTRSIEVVGVDDGGDPISETIVLNGTTPVPTVALWSKVWAIHADAISGSRVVTMKQGAAGTTRGTLPINLSTIWTWVTATSKAAGLRLPDLTAGSNYGVWREHVWAAAAGGVRPNDNRIKIQEA